MTYRYALIDTANTFFRARHVASRNSTLEEKIGMALHLTLASVNQAVRKYQIDHVVFCLEGRSWRKDVYEPYKKNRVVDTLSQTEAEKEENARQKRKDIALACKELFFQNGISNLTISKIATTAGVGKGTIYDYFKNPT